MVRTAAPKKNIRVVSTPNRIALKVVKQTNIPVYQQIVDGIRSAVATGQLKAGDALPAIRDMAADLGVNQMTVSKAYKALSDQGVAQGKSGGGTRILAPISLQTVTTPPDPAELRDIYVGRMAELAGAPGVIAFTDAYPSFSDSDLDEFRVCLNDALQAGGTRLFAYGSPAGDRQLREVLAEMISEGGSQVSVDQMLVTSGAQQALDLAARMLLRPGDKVAVESPCYFGALEVFHAMQVGIVSIPMTTSGPDVAAFAEACSTGGVKAFYTVPTVHNPTGVTTTHARRAEIAEVAKRHRVAVIEDDYSPELHFGPEHPKSYFASDSGLEVYYLRSLGKAYLPGTRLGLLIPPKDRIERALQLKRATDMHSPFFVQAAAAQYLMKRQIRRSAVDIKAIERVARTMYSELVRLLPTQCHVENISGGLSFWISLPVPTKNADLYFAAIRHSVAFALGSAFEVGVKGSSSGIRVSFGGLDSSSIGEGCLRLSRCLCEVLAPESVTGAFFV